MQKFDSSLREQMTAKGKYTIGGKIKTAQSTSRNYNNNNITSSQVIINRDISQNEINHSDPETM